MSPKNNSRGKNKEHSAKFGQFDNLAFKENRERIFDQMFNYHRDLKEKLVYSVTMDEGCVEYKKTLNFLEQMESNLSHIDKDKYLDVLEGLSLDNVPLIEELTNVLDVESLSFLSPLSVPLHYEEQLYLKRKKELNSEGNNVKL